MSEKRFQKGMNLSCVDTETGKSYWYACNLCGLLNEQQDTIRKLQDLCGKSDYENAKLRIENKRLQEEIERLQKIIDLTQYQLKVQDRILKEVGE